MRNRNTIWRHRRRHVLAVGLMGASVFLTGCLNPSAKYISSSDNSAYTRIPASWETFSNKDLLADASAGLSSPERSELSKTLWLAAFDADPSPRMEHLNSKRVDHPVGQAIVRKLNVNEQDQVNNRALRNLHFAVDAGVEAGTAYLDEFEPIARGKRYRGVDLVARVQLGKGPRSSVMFRQVSLVNQDSNRIASIFVVCKTDCYEDNQGTINQVVDAFSVSDHR